MAAPQADGESEEEEEEEEEAWRPHDWRAALEGVESCLVYCHGGCPDGLGAARLATLGLGALGCLDSEICELEHTDRADKRADRIGPDALLLYVDISPYLEDIPLLQRARRVIVVDHHASVRARMEELLEEMPSIVDLSSMEDNHCAASLVGREMGHLVEGVEEMEKKIALLRKKDVWHYQIPAEWATEAQSFCAYMQMRPRATLAMIDEFLEDLPTCLERGLAASVQLQQNAQVLFEQISVVAEADHPLDLVVLGVEIREELAYDSRHFDKLCRRHANAMVLRALVYKTSGAVDIRLSRTSDDVGELGALARQLHEIDAAVYAGGGGHPFAAGLQVTREHYDMAKVARDLLYAAGAVPAVIAQTRRQDALDMAEPAPPADSRQPSRAPARRPSVRRLSLAPRFFQAPVLFPGLELRMLSRSTSCPCCGGPDVPQEEGAGNGAEEEAAGAGGVVRFQVAERPARARDRRRKTLR